jgi:hypothetical protein
MARAICRAVSTSPPGVCSTMSIGTSGSARLIALLDLRDETAACRFEKTCPSTGCGAENRKNNQMRSPGLMLASSNVLIDEVAPSHRACVAHGPQPRRQSRARPCWKWQSAVEVDWARGWRHVLRSRTPYENWETIHTTVETGQPHSWRIDHESHLTFPSAFGPFCAPASGGADHYGWARSGGHRVSRGLGPGQRSEACPGLLARFGHAGRVPVAGDIQRDAAG